MRKLVSVIALASSFTLQAANVALCVACHGQAGISANPEWPNIAGQHPGYLEKQLRDFKQGKTRTAPTMTAIVATLNNEDITELANLYAQMTPAAGTVPEKYLKRGQALYRGGDFDKHISACIACHGPNGRGNSQAGFPLLSGQNAAYTVAQLQAFKNKTRRNDYNSIMRDISARMDQSDMEAVAYYLQGLY